MRSLSSLYSTLDYLERDLDSLERKLKYYTALKEQVSNNCDRFDTGRWL